MDRSLAILSLAGMLVAIGAIVPFVAATDPLCSTVTDTPTVGIFGVYVIGTEIWLEKNAAPGLQRQQCVRDSDNVNVTSDTFVTRLTASVAVHAP